MATYLLLDGHSLGFRAYFALKDAGMATSSGQETQAVYGFVSMVAKMLNDFAPDGMAVAFDRSEPTFRDVLAPDYKAGRAVTPEPLRQQMSFIAEFVRLLGIPALDAAGYEADDILATLATRLAKGGDDVVIVTGDRDAFQVVEDPHVRVLYNRRGVSDYALYDEAGIFERTGVPPAQYPLLAALRGDPSDNIAGVPGVGEKTAARLVTTYGDLEAIFAHLGELTPKLAERLAEHEGVVRMNAKLTPVVRDVPVESDPLALALGHEDREGLRRLLNFLELRTPTERLFAALDARRQGAIASAGTAEVGARPIRRIDELAPALSFAKQIDATSTAFVVAEAAFAGQPGRSAIECLALAVEGLGEVVVLDGALIAEPELVAALEAVIGSGAATLRLVGHRTKELLRALLPMGYSGGGLRLDTAVAAYLVDPADGQASLERLAETHHLAAPPPAGGERQGGEQLGFALDEAGTGRAEEAARRAETIAALVAPLEEALEEVGATNLYGEIERPLTGVLARMEVAGVAIDVGRLEAINAELSAEARRLEEEVQRLAGGPFNVNSTTQLRTVLYERLGLKPQRRTKTGYSTDAATLERLREEHPIVEALLRYREVEKLRSTYGSGLLQEVDGDGRIHASFNQTVARTGRLSSDQPNLHNIPVRSEEGRRFREVFIAPPGHQLVVADYNQIELRVIAHLSGDPGLIAAFARGRDIHAATASGVFGVDAAEVTPAMRARAKMVSYGLAYGMEAYGLAQRLGIAVEEASTILERFFTAFPAVRRYMETTVAEARRRGYTETALGRRRYLPELASDNFRVRQAAERQAMNAGIQGLAADVFKLALVRLDAALSERRLASRIVLQVHDEILVEVPDAEVPEAEQLVREAMAQAYPLSVPLEVHLATGPTWAGAKLS